MNEEKQYSPKLRDAMKDIEAIYEKYDIGGFTTLEGKGHAEFKLFLEPSWSVASFIDTPHGQGVRIRAKKDSLEDLEKLEHTVGMIMSMKKLMGSVFFKLGHVEKELKKVMGIEYNQGEINTDDRELLQ